MIRRADIDDAPAIAGVQVASWRSTYRSLLPDDFLASLSESAYADRWRRFIDDKSNLIFVIEDESQAGVGVVGFSSAGRERAGETGYSGELYSIYILDSFQRRGYGSRLVRSVVAGWRQMGLDDMIIWVLRDNRPARDFYERLGGVYVRAQPITMGSVTLEEVSYGWPRLDGVRC